MKRMLGVLLGIFLFIGISYASTDAIYNRDKPSEVKGWSINVEDNDTDLTAAMVTELDTTYAQLAAEDNIEILSSSALDITQTVTVKGINSSGNQVSESIALDTADGTTVKTSTNTFRYIDQAEVDIPCVGTITIRRATGNTFITSIPIGSLEAGMVQHFNGDYDSYITGWKGSVKTSAIVKYELRWYPDDSYCLSPSTGYKVLDTIIAATGDTVTSPFLQPIKCDKGGWIVVYGQGTINDETGTISLQGYDTN